MIQGKYRRDIEVEMNDLSVIPKKNPSWIQIYKESSNKLENLKGKRTFNKNIVEELRRLHQSRIIPKFNEDNKMIDKKIAKYTTEIYDV